MTDPTTVAVAILALAVLGIVTVLSIPRPPTLDGERWFKTWLATLLRGETERAGGTPEDWAAAVVRSVPYHPAGRRPEDKILRPQDPPQRPALPGEVALHQALASLDTAEDRWARLYDTDTAALAERLQDPELLGDSYDPAQWIGPGASWTHIAAGAGGPLPQAIRQASTTTWVFVGEPISDDIPPVDGSMVDLLGDRALRFAVSGIDIPPTFESLRADVEDRRDSAVAEQTLRLLATLHDLAPGYGDHLVLVGIGDGIHLVLEALRASAPLRDQVQAVVALGARIGGRTHDEGPLGQGACEAWLDRHFRHDVFDLEANHQIPYFSLQWLDRNADIPGVEGLPLPDARFPIPPDAVDGRAVRQRSIQVVDLGPLPIGTELPSKLVALALCGTVEAWSVAAKG